AAVAIGGVWYVRNAVTHGSPLWPFRALPFGDPEPPFFRRLDTTFAGRPRATLDRNADIYVKTLAGALLVLALGLAAPLLAPRRRWVAAAWAATLVALVSWLVAPFTGASPDAI